MSFAIQDTTAPTDLASLERFPPEILEIIVSSVSSLEALWDLLRASPNCWRVFAIRYASITETVLSGPHSTTPVSVSKLIRAVALVRARNFPFANLRGFRKDFLVHITRHDIQNRYFLNAGPCTIFGPNSLPNSRDVITSVVATAYHISALAQSLLSSWLQRLERSSFTRFPPDPEPIPEYEVEFLHGMGQPTYIEEMRAVRALWIIQLVGEVKAMVRSRPNIVRWSNVDSSLLSRLNTVSILPYRGYGNSVEVEVYVMVKHLPACYKNDTVFRLPQAPAPSQYNRWATMHPRATMAQLEDRECRLDDASYARFLIADRYSKIFDLPPRLGFPFWDYSRMCSLGLTSPTTCRYPGYFGWAPRPILPNSSTSTLNRSLKPPSQQGGTTTVMVF
ncbi:hypothetical protein FPOAC2_09693 [Fusarium poae]|uniref:hypothetical protein n=1 Tax=Fusarium poae TaxID=36050 RepID=UPI001CE9A87D|nr:hypothetical protein FPOAC1_009749 [Fusarium poae]KAG8670341.1 hypothetical protein FPOAC1_009749 [Fusarium poae]